MHIMTCPRCANDEFVTYEAPSNIRTGAMSRGIMPPALSRADNETYICSDCGTHEAIQCMTDGGPTPVSEWPIQPWPIQNVTIQIPTEED